MILDNVHISARVSFSYYLGNAYSFPTTWDETYYLTLSNENVKIVFIRTFKSLLYESRATHNHSFAEDEDNTSQSFGW